MFIRSKHYDNCIQKVKIEVGTLVGLEKDDEAFITLKELPTMDMLRMKQAAEDGDNAPLELLKELLPEIITDHNFYEDEEGKQKMSNEDIASLVFDSLELTSKIVSDYTSASFFTQAQKKESR